jgi:hypothetical protein
MRALDRGERWRSSAMGLFSMQNKNNDGKPVHN